MNPETLIKQPIVALAAIAAALAALSAAAPTLHLAYGGWVLLAVFAAGGIGILLGWQLAEGADQRDALIVILAGAVAMRLAMLFGEPYLSTDIYRYIWDGRVQAAGINPYRYMPGAPELAHLRDAAIFPHINRADTAVTIYPPAAQVMFLAITRLGESVLAMKLGLLAFEAATVAALIGLLRRLQQPATRVVAYAWHPLAVCEIAGSGHIDGAMCAVMTGGLLLFFYGRTLLAGVVVTLGALIKPTALLALPVLWRPWDWRLPLVVLLTAALAYVPYLSVGSGVLGYLGGYVEEEGLASGRGFNVLWLMESLTGPVPGAVRVYVAVAAVVMVVLASPHYPWYFLALVPLLTIHPSATGWVLTLASPLLYDSAAGTAWPGYDLRVAAFTLATVAALAFDAWRLRRKALGKPLGQTVGEIP